MNELWNEIKDHFTINFKLDAEGNFTRTDVLDDSGKLVIQAINFEEEGHSADGKKIRTAVKDFFKKNYLDLHNKVETHTGISFYKSTERTPPFVVLFLAAGIITPEQYIQGILDAPSDAKIVANYVPDDKFVEKLYEAYAFYLAEKNTTVTLTSGFSLPKPSADKVAMLDTLFQSFDMPTFSEIHSQVAAMTKAMGNVGKLEAAVQAKEAEIQKMVEEFGRKAAQLQAELVEKPFKGVTFKSGDKMPEGKVSMKSFKDVFGKGFKADFQVPVWEWDGPHPDVPEIDPDYIFREDLLVQALYAIVSNQRMYLQGDTGSGKTTLLEQIAAHLNWPFARINFDSEITRMDLIGRDTLKDGATKFIDGFLPRYMSGPYILCLDELDFVRPDVAYVMQAATEGNGIVITEDGGRRVPPHPMLRMFGTGNTVGQGDEKGMYQGARPQSIAFLDRFTLWAHVDYLSADERKDLLNKKVPGLSQDEVTTIIKYTDEHLKAFSDGKVLQPISPRGMLAVGKTLMHLNSIYPTSKTNVHMALTTVVLNRATQADLQTLKGIVDRVSKG